MAQAGGVVPVPGELQGTLVVLSGPVHAAEHARQSFLNLGLALRPSTGVSLGAAVPLPPNSRNVPVQVSVEPHTRAF
jgi:hypothetical protein